MARKYAERRKRSELGKEWLTIYSDLMTNLMLFFLMLFALTRLEAGDQEKVYSSFRREMNTIHGKKEFKQLLKVDKITEDELISKIADVGDIAKINVTEKFIKISLPNPVLFDVGKTELKASGKLVLKKLAEILKPIHNEVIIEGHTDNDPLSGANKYFSNWELSGVRALSAIHFLSKQGISERRLAAIAYGEYHPLYSNDTEESRALNRRIEINIVKDE